MPHLCPRHQWEVPFGGLKESIPVDLPLRHRLVGSSHLVWELMQLENALKSVDLNQR